MPQMAPLNWLTLYFFFTLIFILFNAMNFYSFIYQVKSETASAKKKTYNWKW